MFKICAMGMDDKDFARDMHKYLEGVIGSVEATISNITAFGR